MTRCPVCHTKHGDSMPLCDVCGLGVPKKTANPNEVRDAAKYPQHDTDSEHCWCSPDTIVMENGARVIVHKQEQ